MIFETFPVGPLQCNCSIIGDPKTRKAIVVDPGGDSEKIMEKVFDLSLKITSIFMTKIMIGLFLGISLSFPVLVYNLLLFIYSNLF